MKDITLEAHFQNYKNRRFLAIPLAGMIIWSLLIATGFTFTLQMQTWAIYIGTGSIVYLGLGLAKLTGEDIKFKKGAERNPFDTIFLAAVGMTFLTFVISISLAIENPYALPFAIAVQSGLMWLVHGAICKIKVCIFHAIIRTILCTCAFIISPENSFILQPIIVVFCYVFTIFKLEKRWANIQQRKNLSPRLT